MNKELKELIDRLMVKIKEHLHAEGVSMGTFGLCELEIKDFSKAVEQTPLITLDEAQWYGEWCADQDRNFLISNDRETIWKKWEAERDEYKEQ